MKTKAKAKEKRNGRWREDLERADKSADPRFRSLLANHFRLSAMADTKAHIMITIRSGDGKIIHDQRLIHRSMITDLYELGKVLATKKYRCLRYCYQTFLIGLLLSTAVLGKSFALAAKP